LFKKALTAYVEPMGDKVFYRFELCLYSNKPVEEGLGKSRKEIIADEGSLSV
jgi:hypothetical protein